MAPKTDFVPIILFIFLLILILASIWSIKSAAPWLPTPMEIVHKMLKIADVGPNDVVYDLGCGDGRVVVTAARKYGARAVGIENNPLRYLWCQILVTILGLRKRAKIQFGDFFIKDLSEATVVICYLLQETNDRLGEKFLKELRPDTKVVSYVFTFFILPEVRNDGEVSLYRIPTD